jgi:hypothetical protein
MADRPRLLLTAALLAMLAAPLAGRADEPVATAPIPPPLPPAPYVVAPSKPPSPVASSRHAAEHRTTRARRHANSTKRVVAHRVVHPRKPEPTHVAEHSATPPKAEERPVRRRYYAAVLPPASPPWYGYYGYYGWRRVVPAPW